MSEKINSKRAVRRRRTTRRLTRKPIRVPEDKVPRSGSGLSDRPEEELAPRVGPAALPSEEDDFVSQERVRYDQGILAGLEDEDEDDDDLHPTISRPPPDPRALERAEDPHGDDDDDDLHPTLSRPPPDPQALREVSDAPPRQGEGAADVGQAGAQIELTEEMALAAGRLTSPEMPRYDPGEDDQLQPEPEPTPRIPRELRADDEGLPAVVVAPARFISDHPAPFEPPLASRLSPEELAARARALDALSDDEEPESLEEAEPGRAGVEPSHDGSVAVDDSMVLEEAEARPEVRTPPPPPEAKRKKRTSAPSPGKAAPPPSAQQVPPPPPPRPRTQERLPWWATYFDAQYVNSSVAPTRAQVERQCDFICETLELSAGMRLLDMGSGRGLQAIELARRGMQVTGLELSAAMCATAQEELERAGGAPAGGLIIQQADMRELDYHGEFDAVLSLGTSFGLFDDECNADLLRRMHRALTPGGCLFVDVVNRDYVLPAQPGLVWFQGDDCICMEETDFNYFTSRLTVKRTVMREGGRQYESDCSVRLFSLHELGQLIQGSGFRVREVSGQEETRGMFFGSHSQRMLLVADKRTS